MKRSCASNVQILAVRVVTDDSVLVRKHGIPANCISAYSILGSFGGLTNTSDNSLF